MLALAGARGPLRRLVAETGSASAVLSRAVPAGREAAVVERARTAPADRAARAEEAAATLGWRWRTPADEDFPEGLRSVSDPPLGLFVRGRLAAAPTVAVVGSRRATAYGRQVARLLATELARAGAVVVSGMALGVDAAAHEGALEAGGPTWAFWGTGPDRVYPGQHRRLAAAIADAGALVTEYPPGTPPRRHHFPERNRLIAGASQAVVVVEAAARSGALVTARLALDEGREVLAVPGSVLSDLSVGPNALLRLGARPAVTPRDVLEAIGLEPAPEAAAVAPGGLWEHLSTDGASSVDELAAATGRPVSVLLPELLELELRGDVERLADGRYQRRRAGK
jgi:DNA processing protein